MYAAGFTLFWIIAKVWCQPPLGLGQLHPGHSGADAGTGNQGGTRLQKLDLCNRRETKVRQMSLDVTVTHNTAQVTGHYNSRIILTEYHASETPL